MNHHLGCKTSIKVIVFLISAMDTLANVDLGSKSFQCAQTAICENEVHGGLAHSIVGCRKSSGMSAGSNARISAHSEGLNLKSLSIVNVLSPMNLAVLENDSVPENNSRIRISFFRVILSPYLMLL
jgi:hypothetical protein